MAAMDKILGFMRLNSDDDDYYDDEDYYDEEEDYEEEPVKKKLFSKTQEDERDEEPEIRERVTKSSSKITPMRTPKRQQVSGMEVCVIKPTTMEDAREITETLLSNRTIVLNMEGIDMDMAQRIIDFASGSCFAVNGNLQKISNYIFIITPSSVDISGDFQNIMDSFESSGISTDL